MNSTRLVLYGWPESSHIQRWASGLSRRNLAVCVVGLGGEPIEGIDTVTWPLRGRLSYFAYWSRARRAARRFNPDLIHCHYASSFGLWTLGAKPAKTIVSVWGSDITQFPTTALRRAMLGRILDKADYVTVTSTYLRERTIELYPHLESRVTVVPFGVALPARLEPLPAVGEYRLCALKRHKWIYGLDILVKAVAAASRKLPLIHLSLPGDGPETEPLHRLVREHGIESRVSFHGQLREDLIDSFIANHHVVVLPSREEGFGVAALEAGASGRPVIATRVGGFTETVLDGETGILVEPDDVAALTDAIVAMGRDRAAIAQFGAAGRAFVERTFSIDASLDRMITLYDRVLNG